MHDDVLFYKCVAYDDYAFLMEIEECDPLVRDLGDENVMTIGNHKLLTAGGSAGEIQLDDETCPTELDFPTQVRGALSGTCQRH